MSNEAVYDPPPAPDKSTDTVMSEERRLTENSILEELLRNGDITVKEEPLITPSLVPALDINVKREPGARTPSSSHCIKIEVIDLVDDDDDDGGGGGQDHDGDGMAMTSKPHHITEFLTIDSEEESGGSISPPAFGNKGSAGAQHSTTKQPDLPNSVMHKASVCSNLGPVETNCGDSVTQESECCESVEVDPLSKPSQPNTESNTVEEPQCLGPFVEHSSVKCPKCSVVLTDYYQTLWHSCIAEHLYQEKRKKKLKCFFCEKAYATMSALKRHIRGYVRKTYVKCSACAVHLTSVFSFKVHALTHTNQWPFRCDICGHGSISVYHHELHKSKHTNEKPWLCDACGAVFGNEVRLNAHKRVHLERKYECDLCFAKFKTHIHLKVHKNRVHSDSKKEFQCEHCSSSFTTKQQLKYHIQSKHGNSSGGRFVCSICDKKFLHRFAVNRHMLKHRPKNESIMYTCDMCKRNFANKGSLIRHISEHNGKHFSCSHCGMLFTQQCSVKRHVLKIHSSD